MKTIVKHPFADRAEFLAVRERLHAEGRLGGSDVGTAAGENRFRSRLRLYHELRGEILPPCLDTVQSVKDGARCEEIVAERFEERSGKKVHKVNAVLTSASAPHLFASIDRKVEGEDAGLECKTANARREDAFLEGRLPDSYVRQVKTYMKVTGYPRWYAYVWVMGVREVCYLFTTLDEAKPDWCDALVRVNEAELDECEEIAASFFADHVEPGVPPEMDGDEDERDLVKEMNPEATDAGPLVLSGVTEADLANLDAWKQAVAETEGRIAAVEDRIKAELGAFAEGWVGSRKVTWRNNKPSRKVDWKAVVAEVAPPAEVIDRHTAITPGARVLRIGKAV